MTTTRPTSRKTNAVAQSSAAPSFSQALVANVVGLVLVLGLILLAAMTIQAVNSTEKATRSEAQESLDRVAERLRILIRAAEMTAESVERAARTPEVNEVTLQSALENSLAAFEQRPELSYLGISLPASGKYGALERNHKGDIFLWLFPDLKSNAQVAQKQKLTADGFRPFETPPTESYDPRTDVFYLAALKSATGDAWAPSYPWRPPFSKHTSLWGFSYAKAVRNRDGRLIAVIDSDMDLPALNSFVRMLESEYDTEIEIVEMGERPRLINGRDIVQAPKPPPSELLPLLNLGDAAFVNRMILKGEQRLVAARRVTLKGGLTWIVITSRPAPFIQTPLRGQLYQVGAMVFAIVAGLIVISIRLARRFGKPIAVLEKRVDSIDWRDLEEPPAVASVAVGEFRETQLLGEALDRMKIVVRQLFESKEQQAASLALKGAIFDSAHTAIFSLDHQLKVIEWNNAAERLFAVKREHILGQAIADGVRTPSGAAAWSAILKSPAAETYQFIGAQGPFDAEVRVASFRRDGDEVYTLFLNDVSERTRADAALRQSVARFHAVARATGDVVWDWDLTSNAIWWNDNFQVRFGHSSGDTTPPLEAWANRIHPEDRDRVVADVQATIASTSDIWSDEYRFRRSDGTYADVFDRGSLLRDESGRGIRMIGAIQDITDRKMAEQRIRYLATYDGLTGLPNRELIQDRIVQAIAHSRRTGRQLALLYLDLDRFKVLNDGFGHPFGDVVLKAIADRLRSLVREGDTVSRRGGDEFLILLTDLSNTTDAYLVAQKIIDNLDQPLEVQERTVHLSGSIGVSVFPQDGDSADVLIDNADVAMYRAKDLGRNIFQFFTPEMSEDTLRRVNIETQLRGAVAAGQLSLVYQPKVSLDSGEITGCEALLRWHHPELGAVSPASFIPIAESSGLIVPIGDWVLRTACLQAKDWMNAGLPPVSVAVNISARQFLKQDVVRSVMSTLHETDLPANRLELELTESLIAQDVDKVINTVNKLRDCGVKFSIDDFGTGYSSLNYLKRFRVDTLKIDQSFVRDMLTDPEDATIVLAVIALAHNLNFRVIAEGVETFQHCNFLRENQCDEIQGYFFSKPVPAVEFEAMLRSAKRLT